jgi:hypothetical protein
MLPNSIFSTEKRSAFEDISPSKSFPGDDAQDKVIIMYKDSGAFIRRKQIFNRNELIRAVSS